MKRVLLEIRKCVDSCDLCNSIEKRIRDTIEELDYRHIWVSTSRFDHETETPHPIIFVDGEIWKMGDLSQRDITKGLREIVYGRKGTAIPRNIAIIACSGCEVGEDEIKKAVEVAERYKDLIVHLELPGRLDDLSEDEFEKVRESLDRMKMQPGRRFISIDGCDSICATRLIEHAGIEPTETIKIKEGWEDELLEVILDIIKNYCDCPLYENLDPACNTCPMSKVCFTLKRVEFAITDSMDQGKTDIFISPEKEEEKEV